MIGENIKRLLKENGYTQKDLAKRTGLTESTISHYVNNQREPNLEALKRLALALGVSVDELIGHDYPTPALLKAFAEIDRLKVENDSLRMAGNSFKMHYNTAKAEGIKEFAERLKEKFCDIKYQANTDRKTVRVSELRDQMDWLLHTVSIEVINDAAKEMTGGSE